MRAFAVLAAAACFNGTALAEPLLNCASPESNGEAKMCAAQELSAAETELATMFARALEAAQSQYDSVRATGGYADMPNMPDELREVERRWLAFRDANCAYQILVYYGGSMASLAVTSCKRDMTRARIKELRDLVEPE